MSTDATATTTLEARIATLEATLLTQQAMLAAALDALEALTARTPTATAPIAVRTTLPTWNGHSCTSIVRALSHMGGTVAPITRTLGMLGLYAASATITTQHQAARKGQKGAALTTDQATYLTTCLRAAQLGQTTAPAPAAEVA